MTIEYGGQETWQEDLFDLLRSNDVKLFCYVPDGGHKTLINKSIEFCFMKRRQMSPCNS